MTRFSCGSCGSVVKEGDACDCGSRRRSAKEPLVKRPKGKVRGTKR